MQILYPSPSKILRIGNRDRRDIASLFHILKSKSYHDFILYHFLCLFKFFYSYPFWVISIVKHGSGTGVTSHDASPVANLSSKMYHNFVPILNHLVWILLKFIFSPLSRNSHYTVLQKKKVHVPGMRPIYCDRHGPIEKPYVRGLSRSKRVATVSIFCYLVIIFSCVMFWMKNLKFTPSIDAIKRNIWNFLQNFSSIFCANSEV